MNNNNTIYKIIIFTIVLMFNIINVLGSGKEKEEPAQNKSALLHINNDKLFKPLLATETWATYSMGEEKGGVAYANRADVSFRRLRLGGSGAPYSWLSYHFQLSIDRLGEDAFASTKGSYSGMGVWDAYLTAKVFKGSDILYVHAGYFWSAISREYNTSSWSQGSFDRTRANWYMRKFISGKGNGVESGVGLGGQKSFEGFAINYRVGTFEPQAYINNKYGSRLYTGHLLLSIGDQEQTKYKYRLSGNQWRKRKGVTIGFGGATQSNGKLDEANYFDISTAYGADILINYIGLRIDGEYFKFNRSAEGFSDYNGTQWHIRAGYTFSVEDRYIEPTLTYDKYNGEGSAALYNYIGSDNTLDIGINYYLNKDKLKLSLHYLIQDGSVASNTGDYLGMCCQFRL